MPWAGPSIHFGVTHITSSSTGRIPPPRKILLQEAHCFRLPLMLADTASSNQPRAMRTLWFVERLWSSVCKPVSRTHGFQEANKRANQVTAISQGEMECRRWVWCLVHLPGTPIVTPYLPDARGEVRTWRRPPETKRKLGSPLFSWSGATVSPGVRALVSLGTHHGTGTVRDGSMSAEMPPVRNSHG